MFILQRVSQVNIFNRKPYVLISRRNLVRPRASYSELSVNTTRRVDLLSIQIDKYENTPPDYLIFRIC